MTKLIELVVKFITSLLLILLMVSCKYSIDIDGKKITGSGNVITQERKIEPFTKVKVSQGLECEITQSETQKVVVEADDNLINGIITKVENGTLIIKSDYNNYHNVKSRKVRVSIPVIEALATSSGSNLTTKNTLKGKSITLDSSSGSELNANVEYDDVSSSSSSGSQINLSGKALKLTTQSSSGSSLDASSLLANDVISKSSSGSSTDVHALVSIKADASSGSSIDYEGKPKKVAKEESSGGSVSAE